MSTVATVTSSDEAEFNKWFWASLPSLDEGSYPGLLYGTLTDIEKRDHIRASYDRLLSDGFLWRVFDDDGVLMLNGGIQNGATVSWLVGLVGPNSAGSKSYIYTEDYRNARNAFWTSIGITSWTLETAGPNTPIHQHLLNRQQANAIGLSLTENERELTPDVTLMELTVG